ncbi:MAG TPA: cytochrome b/b6 domain-containing protein [Terriglobia bacterium]|nr:cytochrome b/b6 domain-containing protein [Terriglobia bacterium]
MNAWQRCAVVSMIVLMLSSAGRAQDPSTLDCTTCHSDKAQALKGSAHAGLSCTTCHAGIKTFPHPKGVAQPQCSSCHAREASQWARSVHGMQFAEGNKAAPNCQVCHGDPHQLQRTNTWAFKKTIPELCGTCHAQIAQEYDESVHGQAIKRGVYDAPVCTACHTAHSIEPPTSPASTVFPTHIPETCGQCHGNVRLTSKFNIPADRLLSYQASFHGLAVKAGSETAANCASCHGFHLILPSSDPRSTINPRNLSKTCGQCHPGAGTRFALGPVHELPGSTGEPPAVRWIRIFYLIVIPVLIGLMFLHNVGDWLRKLVDLRLHQIKPASPAIIPGGPWQPGEANNIRMYSFERLQHALLLVSFIVLVWTGFAFKYSSAWWARPLLVVVWGWELRALVHRIAAVVFMAVAAMHIISLVKSPRLRRHWLELKPQYEDVIEAVRTFAFNLGLSRTRPPRSSHSYVEKGEYWAVVWGGVLMTITGLMLWAHNLVLAWLPMVFLQLASTIHFYEAVLAALAILVWHFYSVIFDPEVYPMDPAWLTGRSVRRRSAEQSDPDGNGETVGNGEALGQGLGADGGTTQAEEDKGTDG